MNNSQELPSTRDKFSGSSVVWKAWAEDGNGQYLGQPHLGSNLFIQSWNCGHLCKYSQIQIIQPWCSRKKIKKHIFGAVGDYDGMCILSDLYVYTYIVHTCTYYIILYIYITICPRLSDWRISPLPKNQLHGSQTKSLGLGCSHPGIGSPTWEPSFGSQTPSNPAPNSLQHPIAFSSSRHQIVCQISESPLFQGVLCSPNGLGWRWILQSHVQGHKERKSRS